jgi:hypothetical protein
MDLKNNINEPTVKSILVFTKSEVKKALMQYAKTQGFSFSDTDYSIMYPSSDIFSHYDQSVTLYIEVDGNTPAIQESGE